MLERRETYEALYRDFRWNVPERFNIGAACSDHWAAQEPNRVALVEDTDAGISPTLSYGELSRQSNSLAAWLVSQGVNRGDRVALLLPQSFATAIAHIAIYKIGAIALPLAMVFGAEALEYRLTTAGAKAIIVAPEALEKLAMVRANLPDLQIKISAEGDSGDAVGLDRVLAETSPDFTALDTRADDPSMMIFTSGTTGMPKGALHGHRVLLGHMPGVQMHHESRRPVVDAGGLGMGRWIAERFVASLYLGIPVVAGRHAKFDPEAALGLAEKQKIRNMFVPPTALRMLRTVENISDRFDLDIRTIGSGGEALGRETFDWAKKELGISINEFYGQTECNLVLSACSALGVAKPGAIGLPVPGHRVAVIDAEGNVVPSGETGQIAVARPDPVMFLEYWDNAKATKEKFIGDWMTTGDQGVVDGDGYVHFFGRDDDVITSAGYRIGPVEIEDCLTGHPAVALAAAIGKPDELRTEIVKAYLVLKPGHQPSGTLASEIQTWVRERLSAHEYPREIEFVDSMPLTSTGKVIRREFRDRAREEMGIV